jgi:hypothetical protein
MTARKAKATARSKYKYRSRSLRDDSQKGKSNGKKQVQKQIPTG